MEDQPIKSDKAVKISIIAGALLLILLMAFYFIYYLPSRKHKLENTSVELKIISPKQQACKKIALVQLKQ